MKRKIHRTYKFRLYPNNAQTELLAKHFGCTRFVYNYFLNQRKEQYSLTGKTGKSDNFYTQLKSLTELKKQEETAWLKEVNAQSLQFAVRCLEAAYANFFQKRTKFPSFKSKRSKNSFTVPQSATIAGGRLFVPKFKEGIKCRVHREIKGKIGKVTISKTPTGKYFVSVLTEEEYETPLEKTNKSVGVDLGLKNLLVTSEGETFENNRYTKRYERKLALAQRHLSRKKKGSRWFENQRLKVARIYEKIANCRADYLHKCSVSLVRRYDVICIEDLNVKGMVRNHQLAKSISDASWGTFIALLAYKAEWNDKKVVKIDRFYPSSQTCSSCGYVNGQTKDLSVREWKCPACHTRHDRDVNAAINILRVGLNNTSAGTVDYTGGEEVSANLPIGHPSVKPEAPKSLDGVWFTFAVKSERERVPQHLQQV
nr:MAG TPA: endonuclease [Caudoviricetes sp.]